jgi:hypothetical protein
MAALTAALAFLFALVALAQPVEAHIDYTPTMWSSR